MVVILIRNRHRIAGVVGAAASRELIALESSPEPFAASGRSNGG